MSGRQGSKNCDGEGLGLLKQHGSVGTLVEGFPRQQGGCSCPSNTWFKRTVL